MSMSAYSMYLAEHETEKCPCPRLIILWEDRVGEGGGSVAEGRGWGVGGAFAWGGGGGAGRHEAQIWCRFILYTETF